MQSPTQYSGTLHAFETRGCRVEQAILRRSDKDAREVAIEVRGPCTALGLAPRDVVQINLTEMDGRYEGSLSGRSGGFTGRAQVEGRLFGEGGEVVFVGTVAMGNVTFKLLLDLEQA